MTISLALESGRSDARRLERHRSRLLAWITRQMGPLLRSRTSPEDVVQETYLQACRSRFVRREGKPASSFAWLKAVAGNRLKDIHKYHSAERRHPARERADASRIDDMAPPPPEEAATRELHRRLRRAVHELPQELREVVLLRVVEGVTLRELGRRIRKSPSTARALYIRALAELRRKVGS